MEETIVRYSSYRHLSIHSSPWFTSFRSCVVCPRTNTSSQTRNFVRTMLRISSSCWTTMFRSSRLTVFWKFGSKAPVKKSKPEA